MLLLVLYLFARPTVNQSFDWVATVPKQCQIKNQKIKSNHLRMGLGLQNLPQNGECRKKLDPRLERLDGLFTTIYCQNITKMNYNFNFAPKKEWDIEEMKASHSKMG